MDSETERATASISALAEAAEATGMRGKEEERNTAGDNPDDPDTDDEDQVGANSNFTLIISILTKSSLMYTNPKFKYT